MIVKLCIFLSATLINIAKIPSVIVDVSIKMQVNVNQVMVSVKIQSVLQ